MKGMIVGILLLLLCFLYPETNPTVPREAIEAWKDLQSKRANVDAYIECQHSDYENGVLRRKDKIIKTWKKGDLYVSEETFDSSDTKAIESSGAISQIGLENKKGKFTLLKRDANAPWSLMDAKQDFSISPPNKIILLQEIRLFGTTLLEIIEEPGFSCKRWEETESGKVKFDAGFSKSEGSKNNEELKFILDARNGYRIEQVDVLVENVLPSQIKISYGNNGEYPSSIDYSYLIQDGKPKDRNVSKFTKVSFEPLDEKIFTLQHYGIADVEFATPVNYRWVYLLFFIIGASIIAYAVFAKKRTVDR